MRFTHSTIAHEITFLARTRQLAMRKGPVLAEFPGEALHPMRIDLPKTRRGQWLGLSSGMGGIPPLKWMTGTAPNVAKRAGTEQDRPATLVHGRRSLHRAIL